MPVTSIYKIEDELQADKIDSYINSMLPVQMSLSMPKFKMQENIEIKDVCIDLYSYNYVHIS